MQSKPENVNSIEPDKHSVPPSAICSHPWWRGIGYSVAPTVLSEPPSKSSSLDLANVPAAVASKTCQSQTDGMDDGADVSKEMQTTVTQSGSDGRYEHEHQHLQHVTSTIPPVMAEYLVPHTQLELGHSVACASYPYSDPFYGGLLAAYGTQAIVHPHLVGLHQARMPLPLEMTEEPVYVNAKQYHGILRRRQSRAKAELEKKLIKVRKPYLHESRHQHAMRRARGCGGRFLNTKKLEAIAANPRREDTDPAHSVSSGSEPLPPNRVSNLSCLGGKAEVKGGPATSEDMCRSHPYNSNGCYPHHHHPGYHLSAFHSLSGDRGEEGDCSGQQRSGILARRAQHRVLAIQ